MTPRLRLGTRRSKLALAQSRSVAERLGSLGLEVELVPVVTEGDRGNGQGEVGAFVTALERALKAGRVDLAVHSAKDVPLRSLPGLAVAAYPERADPRDALVARRRGPAGVTLATLAEGAVVGTDSPRRTGFLRSWRPDLEVRPLNGNVDTRLRRLEGGEVDALVLAAAGLDRLGLAQRVDLRLEPEVMPAAPGQGALAVQCRADDEATVASLSRLDDPAIRLAVMTERLVLEATGGTCRSPVGAVARAQGDRLRLVAGAAAPDGAARHVIEMESEATEPAARRLAAEAGRQLLEKVVTLVG